MALDEAFGKSERSLTPRAKQLLVGQQKLILGFISASLLFVLIAAIAFFIFAIGTIIERFALIFGCFGFAMLTFALTKIIKTGREYQMRLDDLITRPDEPLLLEKIWQSRSLFWERLALFWFWFVMAIVMFFWTKDGLWRSRSPQINFEQILSVQQFIESNRMDSFSRNLNRFELSIDTTILRRNSQLLDSLRRQVLDNNRPSNNMDQLLDSLRRQVRRVN